MRTYLIALLAITALVACGGDDPATGGADTTDDTVDVGGDTETDTGDDSGAPDADEDTGDDADAGAQPDAAEVGVDTAPDVVPDVAPDVSDVGTDATDTADASDAMDATDATDAVDIEIGVPPAPACDEAAPCDEGYECIDGFCWLPIAGQVMAERDFDFVQPEEIVTLFALLKSLAFDVRFVVIDAEEGTELDPVRAEYGAADVVEEGPPPTVQRQSDELPPLIRFHSLRPDDAVWDGRTWLSEPFLFDLSADVEVTIGTFGTFGGDLGFNAEQVQIQLTLGGEDGTADALVTGYLTREEAEDRVMGDHEDFETLRALLCSDTAYVPDDLIWNLSDVLDCNSAPLDADLDGDGTPDSYYVEITGVFEPVVLLP